MDRMKRRIILASRSPRRRKLLEASGLNFDIIPSNFDERLDDSKDIETVAIELSLGKAREVAEKYPEAFVIGSDTIVGAYGKQLEKPTDMDEARRMLESYAGQKTSVSTGIAIVCKDLNIEATDVDTTLVYFKSDSDDVRCSREEYLATGDWADKAGGYGIQNIRHTLIDRIEGNEDTVIGLPLNRLISLLKKLGINIPETIA